MNIFHDFQIVILFHIYSLKLKIQEELKVKELLTNLRLQAQMVAHQSRVIL
jgi:hypothetical protein